MSNENQSLETNCTKLCIYNHLKKKIKKRFLDQVPSKILQKTLKILNDKVISKHVSPTIKLVTEVSAFLDVLFYNPERPEIRSETDKFYIELLFLSLTYEIYVKSSIVMFEKVQVT